jgi:hypothetical protein
MYPHHVSRTARLAANGLAIVAALGSMHLRAAPRPALVDGNETVKRTATLAAFDIEGQTLARFLEWFSSASGCRVSFSSDQARALAEGTLLSGTIKGFTPAEALTAVLASTDLMYDVPQRGVIRIGVRADAKLPPDGSSPAASTPNAPRSGLARSECPPRRAADRVPDNRESGPCGCTG